MNGPQFYKLVRLYKVSRRREVIDRNLSKEEAQQRANTYPFTAQQQVIYIKQATKSRSITKNHLLAQ